MGDALEVEAKRLERREKVEEIIKHIIDSKIVDFPAAIRPSALLSLLSRKKDGEVNHEDFTVSLGRLLVADNKKLMFQILINHAIGMDLVRDLMTKTNEMDAKLDKILERTQSA